MSYENNSRKPSVVKSSKINLADLKKSPIKVRPDSCNYFVFEKYLKSDLFYRKYNLNKSNPDPKELAKAIRIEQNLFNSLKPVNP